MLKVGALRQRRLELAQPPLGLELRAQIAVSPCAVDAARPVCSAVFKPLASGRVWIAEHKVDEAGLARIVGLQALDPRLYRHPNYLTVGSKHFRASVFDYRTETVPRPHVLRAERR
jgi:hypothetical protein